MMSPGKTGASPQPIGTLMSMAWCSVRLVGADGRSWKDGMARVAISLASRKPPSVTMPAQPRDNQPGRQDVRSSTVSCLNRLASTAARTSVGIILTPIAPSTLAFKLVITFLPLSPCSRANRLWTVDVP